MNNVPSFSGEKFTACLEAFVSITYPDGVNEDGTPKFSYGFGNQDRHPQVGDTITIKDAFALHRKALAERADILNKVLAVELPQEMFDALLSLYFQSGTRVIKGDRSRGQRSVTELFNVGDYRVAIAEFVNFRHTAAGAYKIGLLDRRFKEIALASLGYYGDLSRYKSYAGNPHKVPFTLEPFPEDL